MANKNCQECGCACTKCTSGDQDVHLHVEIENLKQKLAERDNHIVTMETNFLNEAGKFPSGEVIALREELLIWQDKYRRLNEAHRRVQRVNQGLEDKLLKLVDVCETEKNALTQDVASLSHKLAEANYTIKKLTEDNERYKSDVALAIQFLQCKQSNFVSQKFDSLPAEVQNQVSSYMTTKKKPEERKVVSEAKSIKVPIPTFPPTAMVYSVPKSPNPTRKAEESENQAVDIVSAAIMAKVLEERERERSLIKHCDTCTCSTKNIKIVSRVSFHSIGVQTNATQPSPLKLRKTGPEKNILLDTYESVVNKTNVVKVEPNNFLRDEDDSLQVYSSNNSSLVNLSSNSASEINLIQLKDDLQSHHYLCDKTSPTYEVELRTAEKGDTETNVDKTSAKDVAATVDTLKGPRYCSMRVQSGSNNILLDNTHNNVAPILYTRHKTPKEGSRASSVSEGSEKHNRQRTAEWIETSDDFGSGSPVGTRSELDLIKYTEMENNVKKFLFGDVEFLKTVEKGKHKYESLVQERPVVGGEVRTSRSNSHTETDI